MNAGFERVIMVARFASVTPKCRAGLAARLLSFRRAGPLRSRSLTPLGNALVLESLLSPRRRRLRPGLAGVPIIAAVVLVLRGRQGKSGRAVDGSNPQPLNRPTWRDRLPGARPRGDQAFRAHIVCARALAAGHPRGGRRLLNPPPSHSWRP